MGSNQGVVWNDSDFPLQYVIYGAFEEVYLAKRGASIDPKLNLNVAAGAINLDGFRVEGEIETNPRYAEAFVEVPPRRHSSVGLMDLRMNEHKISVRVKVGNFVKYLVKDVVIKSVRDMKLKVRYDLSIKNLADD